MRKVALILTLATMSAVSLPMLGCETDDSLPTRPRTVNPFTPNQKAQDNAEKRALEDPGRVVPNGSSGDAPRQLNMAPSLEDRQVVLLQAGSAEGTGTAGSGGNSAVTPENVGTAGSSAGTGATNTNAGQTPATPAVGQTTPNPTVEQTTANPPASGTVEPNPPPTAAPAENAAAATPGPGASSATPSASASAAPGGWGSYHGAVSTYPGGNYPGLLPAIPANPGTIPMVGVTQVPNTPWVVEHSWGEMLQLQEYPHRAWPESNGLYMVADVKHNPVYYFNVGDVFPPAKSSGTYASDWANNFFEIPWFYGQTVALPVLMVLEPPLAQRTTDHPGVDPNFHGYLPGGPTVPSPTTGVLRWDYPFLNPDGSVKEKSAWGDQTPGSSTNATTMP
jgi:hypothetical protein